MKQHIFPAAILCVLVVLGPAMAAADESSGPSSSDKATLEKQLAEKLSRCRLIGYYQTIGQEGPPKEDEYTLNGVQKKEGDTWLFNASLQYGSKVINVPLEIPVLWAGDTPVISVTDFKIPGMGSYTARVMFHGDHYVGTWNSVNHGGYLWGRIQKLPEHEEKPAEHPAK